MTGLFINGSISDAATKTTFEVTDPATGDVIGVVGDAGPDDVAVAIASATEAQRSWRRCAPRERGEILRRSWAAMIDAEDELAKLIVRESGKPIGDARGEVRYAAEFLRWNAEEAVRIRGDVAVAPSGQNRIITHHVPIGTVAIITPWNFPAAMLTRKIAPALAAGNAVIAKPARQTPLTALRVAEIMTQAGLPDGLLTVMPTSSSSAWLSAILAHEPVRMLSFTGSTEVGRTLLRAASDRVIKTVMELGGNAPFIVLDDADIEAAVAGAMVAKMRHSAETCTAANRFYVHEQVAEEFTRQIVETIGSLNVGSGLDPEVQIGPMIDDDAVTRLEALVTDAVDHGATCEVGGDRLDQPGSFFAPTVLSGVQHGSPITRSEIFGPIVPIITFSDDDDVVELANDTEMGLTSYLYTEDLRRGLRISEQLHAGMIGLNRGLVSDPAAPFGGMKQSGLGREGSTEGIYEFTETQYIATEW